MRLIIRPFGAVLRALKMQRRFVSFGTLFYLALRGLLYRKLRTLLTIFGIVVGIGAIFFLLSFGLGLRNLVTQQVIGDQSIKSIDVSSPNSQILKLDAAAVNKLSGLPHVTEVSKSFSFPGIMSKKGSATDSVVYGIDANYEKLNTFNIVAGRKLIDTDGKVAIINRAVVSTLGFKRDKDALGQTFKLSVPLKNAGASDITDRDFTIVGVIDTVAGAELFIPRGIFEGAGVARYSQVKIVADQTDNVAQLRKQIESQGYQTTSPIDTLAQINQVFRVFTVLLAGFGAIGMIVAVLGMFNTLTISLLERTKEIGLMMALGGRNGDMYRLFVFEAILLSLAGAITGIVSAIGLSIIINLVMNGFARSRGVTQSFQLFSYPLWLTGAMILFMLVVGFLVVLFPARRAKRINPIDALRRE